MVNHVYFYMYVYHALILFLFCMFDLLQCNNACLCIDFAEIMGYCFRTYETVAYEFVHNVDGW